MTEKIDYKFDDASKLYFTSDNHFFHDAIRGFCKRPFDSVEEMNKSMIEKWNAKVPEDGLVFHLGDFAFGGYNAWKKIREQLNGDIILIKGNHDAKSLTSTAHSLFKDVAHQLRIDVEGRRVWLNHFPLLAYSGTYRDMDSYEWNLFGHIHLSNVEERNKGLDYKRCIDNLFPTQYDVGVDFNNFEPLSWYEVNEKILRQINENNNLKMWINND